MSKQLLIPLMTLTGFLFWGTGTAHAQAKIRALGTESLELTLILHEDEPNGLKFTFRSGFKEENFDPPTYVRVDFQSTHVSDGHFDGRLDTYTFFKQPLDPKREIEGQKNTAMHLALLRSPGMMCTSDLVVEDGAEFIQTTCFDVQDIRLQDPIRFKTANSLQKIFGSPKVSMDFQADQFKQDLNRTLEAYDLELSYIGSPAFRALPDTWYELSED